jgi:hypothetical protein
VVVCNQQLPPYAFLDDGGTPAGYYVDAVGAVLSQLQVPCSFVTASRDADLTLIIDSMRVLHFKCRDRQLVEQVEDAYQRLRQSGELTDIQNRWLHPERVSSQTVPTVLVVALILLLLAAVLALASLLLRLRVRLTVHRCIVRSKMIAQTRQMEKYYAAEESQPDHVLQYRYEAILCNPFLAVAFYDSNGQVIAQNEAMRKLSPDEETLHRQPLYNVKGEIANYFTTVGCSSESI